MEIPSDRPLCGLVLAGGRSSRMGRDKASLPRPDGVTWGRYAYDLLEEAGAADVYLSLRAGQGVPDGFSDVEPMILRDGEESGGPVSGILEAMRARPDADWLVVACDLPSLEVGTLTDLLAEKRAGELFLAYRSEVDGKAEPLCAWYASGSREVIERAGTFSMRRILESEGCRLIDLKTPGSLRNANDPEDLEKFAVGVNARLTRIFISPGHDFRGRHGMGREDHGSIELDRVRCVAGKGLEGDRYFGYQENYKGQVSFFDAAVADAAGGKFGLPELDLSIFRRNLIVRGLDLPRWIGRKFRFQGIDFEGTEECKPCYWMDEASGREGMEDFLKINGRGGLRARILSDGWLGTG